MHLNYISESGKFQNPESWLSQGKGYKKNLNELMVSTFFPSNNNTLGDSLYLGNLWLIQLRVLYVSKPCQQCSKALLSQCEQERMWSWQRRKWQGQSSLSLARVSLTCCNLKISHCDFCDTVTSNAFALSSGHFLLLLYICYSIADDVLPYLLCILISLFWNLQYWKKIASFILTLSYL